MGDGAQQVGSIEANVVRIFLPAGRGSHSTGGRGKIRGDPAGLRGAAEYRAGARQDLGSRSRAASILVREVAGFGGTLALFIRVVPAPPASGVVARETGPRGTKPL